MRRKAFLTLENGRVFEGAAVGFAGDVTGEVVFTTGMTGYTEMLTDKSHRGLIVVQTFPLSGVSGLIPQNFESDRVQVAGYIVKDICRTPSNFRSSGELIPFLEENRVAGLCDTDTRALTKLIREQGVMNGRITMDKPADSAAQLADIKAHRLPSAVREVSCAERIFHPATESPPAPYLNRRDAAPNPTKIVLWDFGTKNSIIRELTWRGAEVVQLPAGTPASGVIAESPDGVLLSTGPGNPEDNPDIISEIKEFILRCKALPRPIPIFGICLGHELLALARGARIEKLKYGHRGANQPARDILDSVRRVYITSQNHGYAVLPESIDPKVALTRFENVNDGTCEGLDYQDYPAFSAAFHPEASGGPRDTSFLFDRFISMISGGTAHAT